MTKEQSEEVTRCLETIKAAIDPGPPGLTRSLGLAATERLGDILTGSHSAADHAPRRRRKKKGETPPASGAGGGA